LDCVVLSLAVAVVAIALPDSINPSLIAAELFFAAEQHPGRRTMMFALSAWTVTFLIGLALALGLGDLILSVLPKPGATVKYALFTAAGVVLVLGGTLAWIRRKALGSPGAANHARRTSHGSPLVLGGGLAGLELVTAFPYFAAIAMIVGSSASGPGKVWLLVLYCIVYTLPLLGIAVVCLLIGDRAEDALRPAVEWMLTRWPVIVAPIAVIIGAVLTIYGVVKLSSL
jgi:cytochrome c biogenesis protein CcdA